MEADPEPGVALMTTMKPFAHVVFALTNTIALVLLPEHRVSLPPMPLVPLPTVIETAPPLPAVAAPEPR
jgi:hypothetical protein